MSIYCEIPAYWNPILIPCPLHVPTYSGSPAAGVRIWLLWIKWGQWPLIKDWSKLRSGNWFLTSRNQCFLMKIYNTFGHDVFLWSFHFFHGSQVAICCVLFATHATCMLVSVSECHKLYVALIKLHGVIVGNILLIINVSIMIFNIFFLLQLVWKPRRMEVSKDKTNLASLAHVW